MADPVRDFRGTEDGEWAIVNGDFDVVAGAEAVPQGIRVRVSTFLGECLLDESKGVDYVDSILVKNPDPLVVRAIIEERISDTPDVTSVVGAALQQDGATREASIDYTVGTVYGEDVISDSVSVP
jgi:hypothetical protein